ncbi:hypothetical protein [Streptomyces sp. NPDC058268]
MPLTLIEDDLTEAPGALALFRTGRMRLGRAGPRRVGAGRGRPG